MIAVFEFVSTKAPLKIKDVLYYILSNTIGLKFRMLLDSLTAENANHAPICSNFKQLIYRVRKGAKQE
jgi:hypothetical protein